MQHRLVDLGTTVLAVHEVGDIEAPPALLLHGLADVARSFAPLVEALSRRYRVIAPDLRGHGRSDHPGAYSITHHLGDVVALLDDLDIEAAVLLGHSMGGHILSQFAGLFPERCRALVLLEGIGPPLRSTNADTIAGRLELGRARVAQTASAPRRRVMKNLDAAVARFAAEHPAVAPSRIPQLVEEMTIEVPGGVTWRQDPRARDWLLDFDRSTIEDRWAAVRAPTLVLTGAEAWERWWVHGLRKSSGLDPETGPDKAEIERKLSVFADVEHALIKDAGHMLHLEQPDLVVRVVEDFLSRRDRPTGEARRAQTPRV